MTFEEIKKDSYLKKFIEENGLSDDFVASHLSVFSRVCSSRNKCLNCPGLSSCGQKSKGERSSLSYSGVLIEEMEYCDYALHQLKKDNLSRGYLWCDIPKELMSLELDHISYAPEQKVLYAYLLGILYKKREKGLYICGDMGVGKTYLSIALANSLARNNEKVAFVKVTDFFNTMRSYYGSSPEMIDKTVNKLKNADYLILDDIGAESVSEFVRDDILLRILDYRMENKKTTIFTSNLNKEDLQKHYQYDRKEKSNLMKSLRLMERINILTDDYVLSGRNLRR